MFFLRSCVQKDGENDRTNLEVKNEFLGRYYNHICRYENYDGFKLVFKKHFGKEHYADSNTIESMNCDGFIVSKEGTFSISRFMTMYIMTEAGSTFEKLSKGESKILPKEEKED